MYSNSRISNVKLECNSYKDKFIFVDSPRNETQIIRHPKEKWNFQKTIIKFNNITTTDIAIFAENLSFIKLYFKENKSMKTTVEKISNIFGNNLLKNLYKCIIIIICVPVKNRCLN